MAAIGEAPEVEMEDFGGGGGGGDWGGEAAAAGIGEGRRRGMGGGVVGFFGKRRAEKKIARVRKKNKIGRAHV